MDLLVLLVVTWALFFAVYHEVRKKVPGFRERYYHSTTWRKRSRACRRWSGYRCRTKWCKGPAHLAHHRTYRNFASWTPIEYIDLVALCRSCHHGLHQTAKGRMTQAKKKNPYTKYDTVLSQTTADWVSGEIRRELIDR